MYDQSRNWFKPNLAYLFHFEQYKSVNYGNNSLSDAQNWMGAADRPLTGFSWKKGSAKETSGILIWSDVFLHKTKFGEKLAIILTDTQGLFDTEVIEIR